MMPMLIGGGLGLLANKKDPLKGALLGAGMGAAGGALAPSVMGAGGGLFGQAAIDPTTVQGASALMGDTSSFATGGLFNGGFNEAIKQAQPALQMAQQGLSMMPQDQPVQPGQVAQTPMNGSQTLAAIAQGPQVQPDAMEQERMRRRMQRRGLV
jgi:hypothetical protein